VGETEKERESERQTVVYFTTVAGADSLNGILA
jgi:hypothetical protein